MVGNNIRSFYDSEIALMEHEMFAENDILEWTPEHLQWYIAGVHDFADAVIRMIQEKEAF